MGQRKKVEIGIAPLVDCVFLLLIFFLLTSSFQRERLIDVRLPETNEKAEAKDDDYLNVLVKKDGVFIVEGREVEQKELILLFRSRKERRVNIFGDGRTDYSNVARVLQLARCAGVRNVGLAFEVTVDGD